MPTISGVWKWNGTPVAGNITESVNFTSNSQSYSSINISREYGDRIIVYDRIYYGSNMVYEFEESEGSPTWYGSAYQIIDFGSEPQTVSQDFYDYLTTNAEQVYTVSGVWKWNDVLSQPSAAINQTLMLENLSSITQITIAYSRGNTSVTFNNSDVVAYQNGAWQSDDYKVFNFGSSTQEVSQDFYNYLTANATSQSTPTTVKAVSSANLAEFKAKCDETYAAVGNIPTVSTELVNLGTLSTSGTLTTDQVTQIGTTTVGVTARASVNSVTRFYERVNISGTTATLVSADDDALHVLTVNLSTRAYTLSDVALGGGDSNPTIPTPTTSDNGKVLGVENGAYALQAASSSGTQLYHHLILLADGTLLSVINKNSEPYNDATVQYIATGSILTDNLKYYGISVYYSDDTSGGTSSNLRLRPVTTLYRRGSGLTIFYLNDNGEVQTVNIGNTTSPAGTLISEDIVTAL